MIFDRVDDGVKFPEGWFKPESHQGEQDSHR
jgi:hypothetical protein